MLLIIVQLIMSGLLLGGVYALVSVGLVLIFGVLEIFNFAHGEFLMLGMYAGYWLFYLFGFDPYVSLLIIIPLFFFLGFVVQRIIFQPLLNASPLDQVFATMGLSLIIQNAALYLWKADYRTVRTAYSTTTIKIGQISINFPRLVAFAIALGGIFLLFIFLKKTYIGKAIRALAQQKRAAMLMGVNIYRTYQIAFSIGIVCVGIAGTILVPIYYVFPSIGTLFGLTAFVVVILGGYNSLPGALVGGLIIGLVETFSGFFISPHLKQLIYFAIFILLLLIKPTGLFGRKTE